MELKEVRCFQHCKSDKNIFCFQLPTTCPLCFDTLSSCSFIIPPFCLPSPFVYHISTLIDCGSVSSKPIQECSIVVKPTDGCFLSSYSTGDDLHIGITNSNGHVFSYNEEGVLKELSGWDCSLCLTILPNDKLDDGLVQSWDSALDAALHSDSWSMSKYHVVECNCYTFVISILSNLLKVSMTKHLFCENHLLPVTTRAAKYISLYKDVNENHLVVNDVT